MVLVDDILTTGATTREISKVLKREGQAGRILVLTVARVALPGELWGQQISCRPLRGRETAMPASARPLVRNAG